jgi:hypothetical protein
MVKVLSLLRSVVEVLMPILCICQFHSGFATLSDVALIFTKNVFTIRKPSNFPFQRDPNC